MAFGDSAELQRRLDEGNRKLTDVNTRSQREALALQTDLASIESRYSNEIRSTEQNINTLQSNVNALQKDIGTYQKKQTEIQNKLQEMQDAQTALQTRHNEQHKRLNDYMTKLAGLQRDKLEAEKRVRDSRMREIESLKREAAQISRGIGTMQADVARALANQMKTAQANTNRGPEQRGYGNLRK